MEHDASDILGHTGLPVVHGKSSGLSSFSMGQSVFIGAILLVVYMVTKRLWKRALLWQERSYKLATRRRHGIPDTDLRPFNVAYSAAMTRAREEESRNQVKSNPLHRPQGRSLDRHDTQAEQTLRHRTVPQQKLGTYSETIVVPAPISSKATASSANPSTASPEQTFMNHYIPRQPVTHSAQASSSTAPGKPLTRQPAYAHMEDWTSDNEGKKRSLDEQEDDEHEFKKSRVDEEELIDGNEEVEIYDVGHTAPKRGSKRGFGEEDEDDGDGEMTETKKFRGKRARKASQEKTRQFNIVDDDMDIDDEELDDITELRPRSRGKKRDRAEAGSTFGGEDEDSAAELGPEDDIKARRRRRKRRTVAKRKSEASHARGTKRDRDIDEEQSNQESEDGSEGKGSRKKRGKRTSDRHENGHASRSDVSMDGSINSIRGKVRSIGEEWESNGIKYKVGPNGQRLRQALVKQARQKFVMPVDSQHPDRDVNVQICIECWLTEEEYQEKKTERMLAWQDSPPLKQEEPSKNLSLDMTEPQLPQGPAGKNLLWSSSTSSTPTASPASHSPATETPPESAKPRSYRDSYRHSIATTVGLPISPFGHSQIPTVKRIGSTTRASLSGLNGPPGLSDSTNGTPRIATKVFSKWEKQELEAQAIMKMREANRKKELEREAKLKEEKEKADRAAAERAERLDRERVEKERIERERAEAEKKAKEAIQVPKITVTAPSSGNVTTPAAPTSTNVPNLFSKAPTGSTTANSTTSQSIPNSFFNNTSFNNTSTSAPSASHAPAEPTKSQSPFNFNATSGSSTTGNAAPSSPAFKSGNFSFPTTAPSTEQKTEGSAPSVFSVPFASRIGTQALTPATESSKPTPAQSSQPPFSLPKSNGLTPMAGNRAQTVQNPPAQPNPSATSSSSTNAPLKFSFNIPNKQTVPNPTAAASTTAFPSSSSSLSGALGSDQQKTATNAPTFNFKLPTTPASATASTSANATFTTPTAATISAPKFTFGTSAFNLSGSSGSQDQNKEPSKSAFGNTNTASAFSSNSGTGASPFGENTSFQGQTKEPVKTSFASNTSAFANNALGTNTSTSQGHKSVFGGGTTNTTAFSSNTGTSPSSFGGNSSLGQGQKSAFGGGSTNATTAFSNNTGTSPSPFGLPQTQTSNALGSNVFGGNSTEAPKSIFGNGASTSTSTTSAAANTTTTPKFSFPLNNQTSTPAASTTTPSGTPAAGSGAFSFAFGQTPATTTTPQSSPFGASSAFGNTVAGGSSSGNATTKTPSVFGGNVFGTPASQEK